MPIYTIQGPDGKIYEIEGPAGATKAQVVAAIQAKMQAPAPAPSPEVAPAPIAPPKKEGFGAAIGKGIESILSPSRTAIGALTGSAEEAALAGLKRAEESPYADQVSLEKVKQAYERGLLPAAGEVLRQIPLAITEQAPNIAATLGSARLGAMAGAGLGSVVPGLGTAVGTIGGGLLGAVAPSLLQQFGGNIQRQAQEQLEAKQPVNISRTAAAAAAAPQAALDVAATFIPLGRNIAGSVLGPQVKQLLERGAKESAEKLARESLPTVLAKGAGISIATEAPTEALQSMLERAQAGLPLLSDDALKEYGEAAYQAALIAPIGAAARVGERSTAREQVRPPELRPGETDRQAAERIQAELLAMKEAAKPPAPGPILDTNKLYTLMAQPNGYALVEQYKQRLAQLPETEETKAAIDEASFIQRRSIIEGLERQPTKAVLTDKTLKQMGFKPKDGVYESLLGKDMASPDQAEEITQALSNAKTQEGITPAFVGRIDNAINVVNDLQQRIYPRGKDAGKAITPPSGERIQVAGEPGAGVSTQRPAAPVPGGVVPAVEDVGQPPTGEGAKPAPVKPQVEALKGSETRLILPDGEKRSANWEVIEADSVSAAMFEGRAQPRDRQRAASNAQVQAIANNPDFDRLSDTSQTLDYGAPTLTGEYVIVGGNGRFEGINLSYDTEIGQTYKQNLISNAQRFGLDPAQVSGMKKPVLIRKISGESVKPDDTRKLAIQSNIAPGLEMSDMERAALDSERMTNLQELDITDTGDIPLTTKNMGTIRDALKGYTKEELSGMLAADGSLSQSGLRRVKNAVLYKAYGKTDTLSRLLESPDADLKNVGTALMRASGSMSRLMDGIRSGAIPADYDIIADLTGAVETLSALRASGTKVQDFINQSDMFGDGISNEAKTILTFLDQNLRSAKSITEFLNDYANAAISAESAGDGLFSEVQLPSKQETIERAAQRPEAERAAAKAQQTIFEQPAGAPVAEGGEKPEGAGRAPEGGEGAVAKKSLVEMRKRYEAARAAPAPVETKPEPTELDKEIQAKIEELGRVLSRILGRFGLKDVALKLVEDMKAEGEYAQSVIRLALDAVSPVQALRHESIHALKELGFFTPQQWAVLEKQAKSKWVDQYLKNVNINKEPLGEGEKSRYDAYSDLFKSQGLSDAAIEEAIREEAIADAFGDFDVNKAPPGLMQAILNRLRNFFDAVKTAFGGEITAEQVFRKVEKGELKAEAAPATKGEPKSSLRVIDMTERRARQLVEEENAETRQMLDDRANWQRGRDLETLKDKIYPWLKEHMYAVDKARRVYSEAGVIPGIQAREISGSISSALDKFEYIAKNAYTGVYGEVRFYGPPSETNAFTGTRYAENTLDDSGEEIVETVNDYLKAVEEYRGQLNNRSSRQREMKKALAEILDNVVVGKFAKPSLRIMRGEERPDLGKNVTVDKVGKYFDDQIIKEFGGKLDYNNPEHFARAVQQATEEVQYQIKNDKSGLDWYEEDIQKAFKDTAKILPELKKKDNRILFSVIAGIMSPQTIARDNWFIAAKAFEHYVKTGDIPGINPENGNLWMGGTQSANKKVQLEFLDRMVKDLGQKNAIKWMMTPHPVSEINEFRSKYGNIKSGIDGKATDIKPGLYAFGPKIGPFVSNINGIHDVTVDKWFTRTFNRYFGTMIGPDGKIIDAPTEPQRRFIKELANKVAEDAGIKNYQVQSLLWFYEQRLFTELGAQSPSYGFSDGAVKFLESRGKGGGAGVAVPAGSTVAGGVKPSLRAPQTEAFERWFGNSKVVDNNGNPLVVYHGTSYDITAFDTRADMRRGIFVSNELGSWFAEDPTVANAFAQGIRFPRKDGNVMPVYLSIKNPLTVYTYRDLERMAKGRRSAAAMRRDLEKEGYDGILIVNSTTDTGTVRQDWVAFRPEQIKSAIGNIGTYDATKPDIRYSLRATTTPAFKRWFGNSKIVNPDGTPKVMYHGTARDITEFRPKQAGAIFVTDNPDFAEMFADASNDWIAKHYKDFLSADQIKAAKNNVPRILKEMGYRGDEAASYKKQIEMDSPSGGALDVWTAALKEQLPTGPNVMPLYVRAEKPFDYENPEHLEQLNKYEQDNRYTERTISYFVGSVKNGSWEAIESRSVQDAIKGLGFDGFYVKEGGVKNLAVYKPEQLKSATGNIGTFDITKPDIRYSLRSASWSDKRVETLLDKYSYLQNGREKDTKAYAAFVRPEDFLAATTPVIDRERLESEKTPLDVDRLAKEDQEIFLDIKPTEDEGVYQITGHEGRHRMMALRDAGVTSVPVVLYTGGTKNAEIVEEPYFKSQEHRGDKRLIKSQRGFSAMEMIPINWDQRNNIKETFGGEGKIKFSLRSTIPTATRQRIVQTTVARDEKTFYQRIIEAISPNNFQSFRADALNRYDQLSVYDKKLAQKMGGKALLASSSAESAALFSDLGAGLTASALGVHDRMGGVPVYRNGVTIISNKNGTLKGPTAIFAPLAKQPGDYQAYQYWAGVKRGSRFLADGREQLFEPADIKRAEDLRKQYLKDGIDFNNIQKEWTKFNDGLVDYMVATGVLSKERADIYKKHSDYLPFYRQMDGVETVGPKIFQSISGIKPPKKLKGGEAPIDDFLENIVRNTQSAIQAGIKNIAAQRAADVAVKIQMADRLDYHSTAPNVFHVYENGKPVSYVTQDQLFINAVKSLGLPDLPFIGIFSGPANLLRNLVTKDPGFMLANLMRDSMSAWVTSGVKMKPMVDTISNFGSAIAGKSPEFQALMNSGILGGYEFSQNVEQSGREFGKALRKQANVKQPGMKGVLEMGAKPFTSLWEALEKGSTASDAATRIEIYKRTLAETGNEAEALHRALEVMNFNRKGSSAVVRVLTAAVPFLNARMQGLDVLYRAATGKMNVADAKQVQRNFFIRGATIAALSTLYWALTHDDDEYKKQEQETRDNYWLLPSLGVKIPIPFEIGVLFKVIPERILGYTMGSDTGEDFLKSMARQLTSTLAFNPIPQTVLPVVESMTNFSFFTMRPIVGQGLEGLQPAYQVGPGTSRLAETIGGATKSLPTELQISPAKLDQLISGYTGTMGMYMVNLMDAIFDMNTDSPKPSRRFEQMPLIRRFAIDPEARGSVTAYYELKNSVDSIVRTSNMLERTMNYEELPGYLQDNARMLASKDYILDLEKTMKEFREMKILIRSAKMSAEAKGDAISSIEKMENQLTANIQYLKRLAKGG